METNDNKDLGDRKWNNGQQKNADKEINEGFSGQNIPNDYNPSDEKVQNRLRDEQETDEDGNDKNVKRARHTDDDESHVASGESRNEDNSEIRNPKAAENRDRNYDSPDRYPNSHPDNDKNRGNIKLDDE